MSHKEGSRKKQRCKEVSEDFFGFFEKTEPKSIRTVPVKPEFAPGCTGFVFLSFGFLSGFLPDVILCLDPERMTDKE